MDRPNTTHAIDIEAYAAEGITELEEMLANENGLNTEEVLAVA